MMAQGLSARDEWRVIWLSHDLGPRAYGARFSSILVGDFLDTDVTGFVLPKCYRLLNTCSGPVQLLA